ncbi:MAG: 2-oxoacid:acceptor oxidoreductase family protein, partial [Elusimicrobia bacterium]|nr:2-oxoacid:acceptor oxidoreductase family protein [Elusimicrobiota bacterium]
SRIPFLHFFDGFRTSHELNMVELLSFEQMKAMLPEELIALHKQNSLDPERPMIKGTAQNPDVFFQAKETVNKFYDGCPAIVEKAMNKFAQVAGRKYSLFDYHGDANAEQVIIIMASGADTVMQAVDALNAKNAKTGVLIVRLYRPFSVSHFVNALPKSAKAVAVLDRTKEPGSLGEPLYEDVCSAFLTPQAGKKFSKLPTIVGGRYGLGSKEFTPAMAKAVFDNLKSSSPKNGFTVGINDDVTNTSLDYDATWETESKDTFRALFFGLGADGTVGANKNTIKIISEETDNFAQGYFVYDSKKAGSLTVSHVRFGKKYIRAPFLVQRANFIGCHQFSFLEKYEMLSKAEAGAIFLLNSPYGAKEVWSKIPIEVQKPIIEKKLKFYVIDAAKIAKETNMGSRINVIMQTAFFAISGVLPKTEAITAIKTAIKKTYTRKGEDVVKQNYAAVDATIAAIEEVKVPAKADSKLCCMLQLPDDSPEFVKNVLGEIIAFRGDDLPVSKFPPGGVFPSGTSQYEKRNIALESPVWDPQTCIQCGICSLVCPHAAIRMKGYDGAQLSKAPKTFKSAEGKMELKELKVTVQVAIEDCTGCGACVYNCPAYKKDDKGAKTDKKAINLEPQIPLRATEA